MNSFYKSSMSSRLIITYLTLLINTSSYSQNWNEVIKATASDKTANDRFGVSVSISGNYAIVGAWLEDEDTTGLDSLSNAGSAYIFERNVSGAWIEVQKIVASDRAADDYFGASVSISGDYAIVGSSTSANIFERNGLGVWNEVKKFGALAGYATSSSVSISGDYAIFGSAPDTYIFERNSFGVWNEAQKISASDGAAKDWFGYSVSISGDYAIVGAALEDQDTTGLDSLFEAGSAYVFERNASGVWNEVQKIVASDREEIDQFGYSVSISGDYAIVGAHFEDEDSTGLDSLQAAGSAYVFERNGSGVWEEVQKIVTSDRASGDAFGCSVSISGNYAIIGAHYKNDTTGADTMIYSGSVYVFKTKNATGVRAIENTFDSKLLLYPNPTDRNFSIDLGENHKSVVITITDMNGKLIQSNNYYESQLLSLKLEEPAGIYLLIIESENKKAVIRIVKK